MVYKKSVKRNYKKYSKKNSKKSYNSKTNLVRLIKNISLKQSETKSCHRISENNALYHNVPFIYGSSSVGMLYSSQSTASTDTGISAYTGRIGDNVKARGIALKLWLSNKSDRPSVIYRIIVYWFNSDNTITAGKIFSEQSSSNNLLNSIHTESIKPIWSKLVRIVSDTSIESGSSQHETAKLIQHYIRLNNYNVRYNNGSTNPSFKDIGICVVAYDSYGTLTTDNIASLSWNYKFYFKDP